MADIPYTPYRERGQQRAVRTVGTKPKYESVIKLPDGTQMIRPQGANLESQMVNIAARNEILAAFRSKYIQLERQNAEEYYRGLTDPMQKMAADGHIKDLKKEQQRAAAAALVDRVIFPSKPKGKQRQSNFNFRRVSCI